MVLVKYYRGITGLAQVNGRDELPDDEKAQFDNYYAANVSLSLDFKIIMKTFIDVLDERGIKEWVKNWSTVSRTF